MRPAVGIGLSADDADLRRLKKAEAEITEKGDREKEKDFRCVIFDV